MDKVTIRTIAGLLNKLTNTSIDIFILNLVSQRWQVALR